MKNKEYAWNSEDYAVHSQAQYPWAHEIVQKLGLFGSESVLDIGCGTEKSPPSSVHSCQTAM